MLFHTTWYVLQNTHNCLTHEKTKKEKHMKFQERHKYFALDCFAQFMTRQETTEAFIEKFTDDLPKPPEKPKQPSEQYEKRKEAHVTSELRSELHACKHEDPQNGEKQFNENKEQFRKALQEYYDAENLEEHLTEIHEEQTFEHECKLYRQISNQIRRYDIKDTQFPHKYINHFNKKRKEYYKKQTQNIDNVKEELELIYGHIKSEVFQTEDPNKALKHANTAHALLKTINALND